MRNMTMKRIRTALCLILAAALLAGCAFLPSDSEPETPAPTDPLTGLALEWQGQRPVAVAFENSTAPTTQWGLSSASVVLEALTEVGTSTELCLVYPALAATPKVGPVAAGQDIYWRLLVGQQPIPVQRGGGQFDQNFLDYYSIRAVDGSGSRAHCLRLRAVSGATHRCGTPAARPSLMSWMS